MYLIDHADIKEFKRRSLHIKTAMYTHRKTYTSHIHGIENLIFPMTERAIVGFILK